MIEGELMSAERNRAVVRETANRLFTEGDLSAVDELIAADAVDHCEPPGTDCREHFRQVVGMLHGAFSDFRMTVEDVVAEEDMVAVRLTMTGTHSGPFMGILPTGKQIRVPQMRMMRFRDGQMTESWAVIDVAGMRQQLVADQKPAQGGRQPAPQPVG